jgi:hypothetical protein
VSFEYEDGILIVVLAEVDLRVNSANEIILPLFNPLAQGEWLFRFGHQRSSLYNADLRETDHSVLACREWMSPDSGHIKRCQGSGCVHANLRSYVDRFAHA